jgi:ABC-2 type transport system permease protein
MLWYKAWLETRWRFLIGLALLVCSAAAVVFAYDKVLMLVPLASNVDIDGELGRRIREAAELTRTYRGYAWSQWFGESLSNTWTVFAVVLGSGGLLSQSSRGGALFTLSLPVSRGRLVGTRAATALAELFVLAIVPSLLLPLLSPAIGQSYAVGDALIHSVCLFVAGAVFFSLAFLMSTVFGDVWRPLLIALVAAGVLGLVEQLSPGGARYGIFHVMSGEAYFRGQGLPWVGLIASAALSAAMLYAAWVNIARHDF